MAALLITGASGLLGANLAMELARDHDVSGVFFQHRVPLAGVKMIGADLRTARLARMVVGKVRPDVVIHCAAGADVDRCERDDEWAYKLNRDMAANVAEAAASYGTALVHISTDAVFDGEAGDYREEDETTPINIYGRSKLAGEEAVRQAHEEALVVRTNLYGWSFREDKRSLAEWFLSKLERGEKTPGFVDVEFSPILANDLGPILLDLVQVGARGLLHVGGADCVTKFAFGQRLATAFGYDPELIDRSSVENAGLEATRPKRLCLNSSKAENLLGRRLPGLDEGIRRLAERAPANVGIVDAGTMGR